MKTIKPFDTIEYKRAVQAKLAAETEGLSLEEKAARLHDWAENSDDDMAQFRRRLRANRSADGSK
jgi:hypothetical protein